MTTFLGPTPGKPDPLDSVPGIDAPGLGQVPGGVLGRFGAHGCHAVPLTARLEVAAAGSGLCQGRGGAVGWGGVAGWVGGGHLQSLFKRTLLWFTGFG